MRKIGIDSGVLSLLERAPNEELEYGFVIDALKEYQNPRIKLHHLLKIGALIRVKKGFYVFGEKFARRPFSLEVLANMIYGPSYVSLEWACQYYGLIPEKVTVVTSVTTKRTKQFNTPVGSFSYNHVSLQYYPIGVTFVKYRDVQAQVATKEKALVDLLNVRRGHISSLKALKETLFEDLRITEEDMDGLDLENIEIIAKVAPSHTSNLLIQLIKKRRKQR